MPWLLLTMKNLWDAAPLRNCKRFYGGKADVCITGKKRRRDCYDNFERTGNLGGRINYEKCRLETGKKQPEAIELYKKNGYNIIPNYGQYEGVENSVCFEKTLI